MQNSEVRSVDNVAPRLFIRRSYNIWIVVPTIQVSVTSAIAPWEVEVRWLLWGVVIRGEQP
jgi:hypothetical protein